MRYKKTSNKNTICGLQSLLLTWFCLVVGFLGRFVGSVVDCLVVECSVVVCLVVGLFGRACFWTCDF